MTGQEDESRTKRGLPYGDPLFRRSAYPARQWSRVDFCCDISLPKTGNRTTDPAPRFRLLHSTAKLSPLVRWGLWALRWLCPAPPASSKEQDKSKCVISRSGHLDLRYSPPKTRMNTGFLLHGWIVLLWTYQHPSCSPQKEFRSPYLATGISFT